MNPQLEQYSREDTSHVFKEISKGNMFPFVFVMNSRSAQAREAIRSVYPKKSHVYIENVNELPQKLIGFYKNITT